MREYAPEQVRALDRVLALRGELDLAVEVWQLLCPEVREWGALMGAAEVGPFLGVSPQRVTQLANGHRDFPAAVAELRQGRVYDTAAVVVFRDGWDRRPGRRHKPC